MIGGEKMKIGLLPLYLALYGENPKPRMRAFYREIVKLFEEKGLEVVCTDLCALKEEFENAVSLFENENCDALVTLHMCYSPSLESAEVLKNTKLPIVICDTTETFDFSDRQGPGEIMYCHGIHGVMDMCNLLRKNKKPYAIAAGHYEKSDVIDRVVGFVKSAKSAKSIDGSKVGSIGGNFGGMGDFEVDDEKMLSRFGTKVIYPEKGELKALSEEVTQEEILAEKERNKNDFEFIGEFDEEVYTKSVIADLTLKKWIEKRNLRGLTINFRNIGELYTMPFNGACRAMGDRVGYAGEGDTLTALFTGALLQGYKETSFVELFCPDWENNTIFISHMGEMNYVVADKKGEFYEKNFTFGKEGTTNPYCGSAAYKPGNAIFINIFEDSEGFNALIAPVKVVGERTDNFKKNVRGWLDFGMPISEALEKISIHGATHHSIMIYDAKVEEIEFFAKLLDIKPIRL